MTALAINSFFFKSELSAKYSEELHARDIDNFLYAGVGTDYQELDSQNTLQQKRFIKGVAS